MSEVDCGLRNRRLSLLSKQMIDSRWTRYFLLPFTLFFIVLKIQNRKSFQHPTQEPSLVSKEYPTEADSEDPAIDPRTVPVSAPSV